MWGRMVDVIEHAKFQLNQFKSLRTHGAENDASLVDLLITITTAYGT